MRIIFKHGNFVTVDGITKLKSQTLQVLDVGMFGKLSICHQENNGPDLIAELIEYLPNLISLRTYSYSGRALLKFYQKYPRSRTKLKYIHDTGTTEEIIGCVLNLCPDLENLHLDGAEHGVLEKLAKLQKLYTLKLTKCDVQEFLTFLSLSGARMQVLKLNHNKNISLDLSQICLFAPNLQTLECYQMKLTFTNLDTYFMSLVNVEITYCDMSDDIIRYIMTNSPFLRRIVIGSIIRMTDGDIFRICAECDFYNLEELWFSCAKSLTVTSVELLMGHCKNLKSIGQLNGWDVNVDEIDYLRAVIAFTNTDLKLLYVENV